MDKKKLRNIIVSLSLVITIVVVGNVLYFGTDWFKFDQIEDHSDYTWTTDPNRLTFPESISNITLEVFFGNQSGVPENVDEKNITMNDHYTTVYDVLNKSCMLEYEIWWWINPTFFITGINGVMEDESQSNFWVYKVNNVSISVGANAFSPPNNSVVSWYYTA